MIGLLKRAFGIILIGLGLGILLVLLLPMTGWLFLIGVTIVVVGLIWLKC